MKMTRNNFINSVKRKNERNLLQNLIMPYESESTRNQRVSKTIENDYGST